MSEGEQTIQLPTMPDQFTIEIDPGGVYPRTELRTDIEVERPPSGDRVALKLTTEAYPAVTARIVNEHGRSTPICTLEKDEPVWFDLSSMVQEWHDELNQPIPYGVFAHGIKQILVERFEMEGAAADGIEIGFDEIKTSGMGCLHIRLPITRDMARLVLFYPKQFNPAKPYWPDEKQEGNHG